MWPPGLGVPLRVAGTVLAAAHEEGVVREDKVSISPLTAPVESTRVDKFFLPTARLRFRPPGSDAPAGPRLPPVTCSVPTNEAAMEPRFCTRVVKCALPSSVACGEV